MRVTGGILIVLAALASASGHPESTSAARHVIVCKESGRFGGWPANNGVWSWGNEIVVGFMWGYFKNTIYYFNDHNDGERYIAATVWDPGNGR